MKLKLPTGDYEKLTLYAKTKVVCPYFMPEKLSGKHSAWTNKKYTSILKIF